MDERSRRGEKNPSSSRKRWTDHLGDLPTFRKPFEKASTTLAGKAKGGVEGIWAKVKVFDIFLLSRLLLLSDRDDRDGALASSTHPATAVACEKEGRSCLLRRNEPTPSLGKTLSRSLNLVQAFKVYLDSHHCRWSILESQWLTFALCYNSVLSI